VAPAAVTQKPSFPQPSDGPNTPNDNPQGAETKSSPNIVAIVVPVVVGVLAVIGGVFYFVMRRRRKSQRRQAKEMVAVQYSGGPPDPKPAELLDQPLFELSAEHGHSELSSPHGLVEMPSNMKAPYELHEGRLKW